MTIQKRLWDLVVLAIVIFAAAFATAPWFAFRALKAAAQYEDVQAISELVDFPAVRGSLTAELNDKTPAAAPRPNRLRSGATRWASSSAPSRRSPRPSPRSTAT
jgi:hypothetical protein